MSYCTVSRIDDAIAIAESIVDGMIAKRYTVPLSSPPGNIQAVTADLAASALLSEIIGNRGENGEPTQAIYLRKNAIEILTLIEDGRLSVNASELEDVAGAQARCSTYYHRSSKFARWDPAWPETYRRR